MLAKQKLALKKKNRGRHLILSHDTSDWDDVGFFAQSSLHYRVWDTILHLNTLMQSIIFFVYKNEELEELEVKIAKL